MRSWCLRAALVIIAGLAMPATPASAAAQPPTIFVPPPAPAITATPQSAPAGSALAVGGTSIPWKSCQLYFDQQPVVSTCDVRAGTLTGTVQVPMQAVEGSHQITACNQSCSATQDPAFLTAFGCCPTASTTVTVVAVATPTPTPPRTPTLVAVPSLHDLNLNAALAKLHALQLLGGYSIAMPHGHVATQRTVAGTLVPLHSRVYFTLQPWAVVPALRDLTVDQARDALGTHLVLSTKDTAGIVAAQHPDAGVEVPYGTVVSAELVVAATATPDGRSVTRVVIGAGIGVAAVVVGAAAVARAVRGRRRRKAHLWYRGHVRWTTTSRTAATLTEHTHGASPAASVRLVLRDTSASSCQLEEAPIR